jgi:hypothetical protein
MLPLLGFVHLLQTGIKAGNDRQASYLSFETSSRQRQHPLYLFFEANQQIFRLSARFSRKDLVFDHRQVAFDIDQCCRNCRTDQERSRSDIRHCRAVAVAARGAHSGSSADAARAVRSGISVAWRITLWIAARRLAASASVVRGSL